MDKMWAAVAEDYGDPSTLQYKEVARPTPKAGEVLIKQESVGIAFGDIGMVLGRFHAPHTYGTVLPCIPGCEGGGTIAAIGEGVTDFAIGDRVAYGMDNETYAQYSVVPAWRVIPVPDDIDLRTAVNFAGNGMTAYYLAQKLFPVTTYYEQNPIQPVNAGDTVVVFAAAGSVGQIMVQLFRRIGARVIALVGNNEKAELVAKLGAQDVILYREVDFVEEIQRLTEGRGADIVYDSVGKETYLKSMKCLRRRGLCVLYGAASGVPDIVRPMQDLAENGSIFVTRPHCIHHYPDRESLLAAMNDLFDMHRDGTMRTMFEPEEFPLSNAGAAMNHLASGKCLGRVFLNIQ